MNRFRKHLLLIATGLASATTLGGSGCSSRSSTPPAPQAAASPVSEIELEPFVRTKPLLRIDFDGETDARGVPAPWTPRVSSGTLDVRVESDPELKQKVLWIRSDSASYLLANTQTFDPSEFRRLSWSWKATTLPTDGDVRKNAIVFGENRNDQAIQLLVVFEGSKVLSFVWDTTAPIDTEVVEPSPLAEIKTRVLVSGSEQLGMWQHHQIDIYSEYNRRFGTPPKKVTGIIVQSNSNHTQSHGEAAISPIEVSAMDSGSK